MDATNQITKRITKVYRGKHGCCCGCRGKYWYPEASAERSVNVNARKVEEITRAIFAADPFEVEVGPNYAAIFTETHQQIVYFD